MVTRYMNQSRSLRYINCTNTPKVAMHSWEWAESLDQLETTTVILASAVPLQLREVSVAFAGTPL